MNTCRAATRLQPVRFADLIAHKLLEIGDGYRAKISELGGDGPIFLRAVHLRETGIDFAGVDRFRKEDADRLRSKMSQPGDTVVTTKGNSVGRCGYVSEGMPQFVYSPHLSYWRSLDQRKLAPGFLKYWAKGPEFRGQLKGLGHSTDMAPYLSLTDQRRLGISLPSPDVQHAIADLLGALDDKIELNRQLNRTLEAMAQALFKSWFVDFDPVVAKAAGRQPFGMDAETAALFTDRFVGSDLGQIPDGWSVGKLRDAVALSYGKSLPESRRVPGNVPVFGSDGRIGWHVMALVNGPGIVVGRKGNAGCVNWSESDFFPIDTTYFVAPGAAPYPLRFLRPLLELVRLQDLTGC